MKKILKDYKLSISAAETASELRPADNRPQGIIVTTELSAVGDYHTEYCDLEYYYKNAPYHTYKRMAIDEWCDQMETSKELIW